MPPEPLISTCPPVRCLPACALQRLVHVLPHVVHEAAAAAAAAGPLRQRQAAAVAAAVQQAAAAATLGAAVAGSLVPSEADSTALLASDALAASAAQAAASSTLQDGQADYRSEGPPIGSAGSSPQRRWLGRGSQQAPAGSPLLQRLQSRRKDATAGSSGGPAGDAEGLGLAAAQARSASSPPLPPQVAAADKLVALLESIVNMLAGAHAAMCAQLSTGLARSQGPAAPPRSAHQAQNVPAGASRRHPGQFASQECCNRQVALRCGSWAALDTPTLHPPCCLLLQ